MEKVINYTIEANLDMPEVQANFGKIFKESGARIIDLRIGGHTVKVNVTEAKQIADAIALRIKEAKRFSSLISTVNEISCSLDSMISTIQAFKENPLAYAESYDPCDIGDVLDSDLESDMRDLECAINQLQ